MQESMSADVAGMAPEMMNYDMAVAEAEVSSTGDLSAAVVFSLPHKHTILTGKEKVCSATKCIVVKMLIRALAQEIPSSQTFRSPSTRIQC